MAETPIRGRGKPVSERFEVFETDLFPQLTEEQKTWKVVKASPKREHFEILEEQTPRPNPEGKDD